MQLILTPLADGGPLSEAGVVVLPPDIVLGGLNGFSGAGQPGFVGDFAMATGAADGGIGGLRAADPLQTAFVLCLFTDARADVSMLRSEHNGDARGWPGDGFDLDAASGEGPLGSTLWQLRREVLSEDVARRAAAEAERATACLIRQGAVARITVEAVPDYDAQTLRLDIGAFARDGSSVYAAKFDLLWSRADGGL
ncbi:phage GP46 family protein [uncultured Methylobacterium sp.]|uniref:phage GP46 family protein n=1 Tax=uncultured Methylobacterium sp. TaxID=157278 RepID=UPI0035CB9B88